MNSDETTNGKTTAFWKKNKSVPGNVRVVYGAMHPPIMESPRSSGGHQQKENASSCKVENKSTFQNFQESVNDAWDCQDDEFCVISDVKISNRLVKSAALSVINSHKSAGEQKLQNDTYGLCTRHAEDVLSNDDNDVQFVVEGNNGSSGDEGRLERFQELLSEPNTDLLELRKCSWSGIPSLVRGDTWRLLNGYLPPNADRQQETLQRKRDEYWSFVTQYYETRYDDSHQDTFRQIHIDIPRMAPLIPLFQQTIVQHMFERLLYMWAIRHPASGYVQGMNDLVTPFFIVFLYEVISRVHPTEPGLPLDTYDVSSLSESNRNMVEADSFWCMSKLLDGIQDNYTFAQPGIQNKVLQLKELMKRIDRPLHSHLEKHDIDYLQFSFRWFNNLLMRELPLACTVRLWDTLHAEPDGFSHFLLYVCAAFLKCFSHILLNQSDFQGLMLLLQNLPTSNWVDKDMSILVAEAFRLKYTFADAPNHLHSFAKR